MNCMNKDCDNALIGKQRTYCSDRCRKAVSRTKPDDKVGQVSGLEPSLSDLELCRYCSEPLPKLLKPRRWPGACYPCAIKAPRKSSIEALGELVYAGSEYVPPKDIRQGCDQAMIGEFEAVKGMNDSRDMGT